MVPLNLRMDDFLVLGCLATAGKHTCRLAQVDFQFFPLMLVPLLVMKGARDLGLVLVPFMLRTAGSAWEFSKLEKWAGSFFILVQTSKQHPAATDL